MEQYNRTDFLELMAQPSFCVQDGCIRQVNAAAAAMQLTEGTDVFSLLRDGSEEYREFAGGTLFLTLLLESIPWSARVSRVQDWDVFQLEPAQANEKLQALAVAAQSLRAPLSGLMICADQIYPRLDVQKDPKLRELAAHVNQNLFRLLRIVSNMSDAADFGSVFADRMEYRDAAAILDEIFRKAAELTVQADVTLQYQGVESAVTMVNYDQLERGILNVISNSLKFTPKGGWIRAKAFIKNRKLYLQIADNGSEEPGHPIFSQYAREPQVEDGRTGIGLGMTLVCAAAALHGGTVLVDRPDKVGTRVTMTIAIRPPEAMVRSPRLQVDYAGEREHGLVELADVLPPQAFVPRKLPK